jgi:hypothetical protein
MCPPERSGVLLLGETQTAHVEDESSAKECSPYPNGGVVREDDNGKPSVLGRPLGHVCGDPYCVKTEVCSSRALKHTTNRVAVCTEK